MSTVSLSGGNNTVKAQDEHPNTGYCSNARVTESVVELKMPHSSFGRENDKPWFKKVGLDFRRNTYESKFSSPQFKTAGVEIIRYRLASPNTQPHRRIFGER
jgi:hypothetical protein